MATSPAETARVEANAAVEAGELEVAEAAYGKVLEMSEADGATAEVRSKTLGNRSLVRCKLGNAAGALEDAIASIEADQTYAKAHERKAQALLALGRSWEARKTYADALAAFDKANALDAQAFFRNKLRSLTEMCAKEDRAGPVASVEHFHEILKYIPKSDPRMRLATMATFWNDSSQADRLVIFRAFLMVLTGSDQLRESSVPESNMAALPMENYSDIEIPSSWSAFYGALSTDEKVGTFHLMYALCSKNEQTLIARDLAELFPKPAQAGPRTPVTNSAPALPQPPGPQ